MKFISGLFFVLFVSSAYAIEQVPCAQYIDFGSSNGELSPSELVKYSANLFGKPLISYEKGDLDLLNRQISICRVSSDFSLAQKTPALMNASNKLYLLFVEYDKQKELKQTMVAGRQHESRKADLMSGAIKISSIDDVVIEKNIKKSLIDIMSSPLLSPDKGLYAGGVNVDGQDSGFIRGKFKSMFNDEPVMYAFLKTTKNTIYFNPSIMRIGAPIGIVGRYIGNMNYTTVLGEKKIAPIIECEYIGEYPDDLPTQIVTNQQTQATAPTAINTPKNVPHNNNLESTGPTEDTVLNKYKASFDCRKASTNIEKTICATPLLSKLDGLLSNTYQERMEIPAFGVDKKIFKADGRAWLKNTRNLCSDVSCLEKIYRARIKDLCEMPVVSGAHPTSDCDVIQD